MEPDEIEELGWSSAEHRLDLRGREVSEALEALEALLEHGLEGERAVLWAGQRRLFVPLGRRLMAARAERRLVRLTSWADPAEPGDEERLARLQAVHAAFNARFFGGILGSLPIELSSRMRRKLGHYQPVSSGGPVIAIGRRHLRRDGWRAAEQTLLHEMVHQWQAETGQDVDHGPGFRRMAKQVGIVPSAVRDLGRARKAG